MRVTNSMISNRVVFNMQRTLTRLLTLQGQMSSGRRIEKPSDDPIGTLRDLNYRTELNRNEQYIKNINKSSSKLTSYQNILSELNQLVVDAKDEAIGMSNDDAGADSRALIAVVIKSKYDSIVALGNKSLNGKHLFSGFKTDTAALSASANGVVYNGDMGKIEYPIESSTKMTVNLNGSDIFFKPLKGIENVSNLHTAVTGVTQLTDLNGGTGIDQTAGSLTISDNNLGITSTVDINGATDINDVLTAINNQLAADGITNVTAVIGAEKNNIKLEIDESIPRQINDNTNLFNLNNGHGLDMSNGWINVSDGGAINESIDLSSAATVGDIRTAFNNHMTALGPPMDNVSMQINAAGTGFEITDTNGVPLGLTIQEFNSNSTLATDLGIAGNIGAMLVGGDLDPEYNFTVAENGGTTANDLGLLGNFNYDHVGSSIKPQLSATSLVSDLNYGLGIDLNEITVWQGNESRVFDLTDPAINTIQDVLDLFNNSGLDITLSLNQSSGTFKIVNNDPYKSLTVEDSVGGTLTKKMGIFGSTDLLGSMLVLTHALENNDREGIELMQGNLDQALTGLRHNISVVGSKNQRLESTLSRINELNFNYTKLLSEVEDADIALLLTNLAMSENSYQAALLASAKIIQPSLLNFLQ